MLDFTTRRLVSAAAIAGALSLSACSAPSTAPDSTSSTAPPSSAAAAPGATAPGAAPSAGPDPAAATPGTDTAPGPANSQATLAQSFISDLVTNKYSLSGQWFADGAVHANTAKLWGNRLSDNLKGKLTAAGRDGDVSGFGTWAVLALPGPDSTEAVKASPSCAEAPEAHCLLLQETGGNDGTMKQAGGLRPDTMDQSVPNRAAFDYDVVVPVSLTGKGNAEGAMKGVLKVDLTFVPNPNPGAGGPEFLIDSIKNQMTGITSDVLAATPGLLFDSY